MAKRILSGPEYLDRFACITSLCEETCCSNWNIEIDPKTYKKYCSLEDENLREKIKKSIYKFPFYKTNRNSIAKFLLNGEKRCPLLTDEKLCSIQLKYGESYLCLTCHSFPKVTNYIDGTLERSLTLACPEAARVVLLNKEQFMIKKFEEDEEVGLCINSTFNTNRNLLFNKNKKHFYQLREITMEILRDRNQKIEDRMFLILIFFSHLGDLVKRKKEKDVIDFINAFGKCNKMELLIANEPGGEGFGDVAALKGLNFSICNEIFEGVSLKKNEVLDYKECYEMASSGLGYTTNMTIEEKQRNYYEAKSEHCNLLHKKLEYIFENYLLNRVYGELFPFTKHGKLYDALMIMIIEYSLLRYHIVGMAASSGCITEEMIIKLIYSYTKIFSHYMPFYINIFKFIKMNFIGGFKHLTAVIKDI